MSLDPGPYDLAPQGGDGRAAALCIHGLTGTPYEVRRVAEAIAAAGIRARGPLLPGHMETAEALSRASHEQWLACVQGELDTLRREHERVFAMGLSLGSLLSLALTAEEHNAVVAGAAVGTPLHFRWPVRLVIGAARHFVVAFDKRGGSDIRDPQAGAVHPSLPTMPVNAVHELIQLQKKVKRALGRIRAPMLVAHGALDKTANPADSRRIAAELGSEVVEHVEFARSGHVVPVDYDGAELAKRVAGFFATRV